MTESGFWETWGWKKENQIGWMLIYGFFRGPSLFHVLSTPASLPSGAWIVKGNQLGGIFAFFSGSFPFPFPAYASLPSGVLDPNSSRLIATTSSPAFPRASRNGAFRRIFRFGAIKPCASGRRTSNFFRQVFGMRNNL